MSSDYKYLEQLLIVIKILSPIEVNYAKVSSLIALASPKNASYGIKIL